MQIAILGLGKMGSRMATKLSKEGHDVVVWNRSTQAIDELKKQLSSVKSFPTIEEVIKNLEKPRVVWSMLPAGEPTQAVLDEVAALIEKNDTIIDGGNAQYSDTQKRYDTLTAKGIHFLGIGVSGGIVAVTEGYPMMVGGSKDAYDRIIPILDSLSKPHAGHAYFGEGGAGHYVKMVHNAIEYGYMQSIGEGFGVLEKAPYKFDLLKVAELYEKGTLVSGFMMRRTIDALAKDPHLEHIVGVIGKASGETIWTVAEAKKYHVPIEIIERSLEIRNESETNVDIQQSFAARMVSALRNAFGGHKVKKVENK